MTMSPDKKVLEQKLQKAIAYARERIAIQEQKKTTTKITGNPSYAAVI